MNEAANPRLFSMEHKDIVRLLLTTVGIFIQDRLLNNDQRTQQKDHCAERLAAEGASGGGVGNSDVRYSDQAVLANLDWGIDALEEAINTTNTETKLARLDYSEKMLQICAMLNSGQKTAGVPNFYLSAWAHLNLAYLWKLRNELHNSVLHVLEMFIVDPFFSRIDFAPELWRELFLPHMNSIVGWYSEARHRLVMEVIPDSSDMSFTADMDRFFEESVVFAVRPDQMEKVRKLEEIYRKSLDENTRVFACFYRDCMDADSGATIKNVVPMMPIADPPTTPLHEVSRSIPDYVKFGPILPTSAGFSTTPIPNRLTKATSNPSSPNPNKSLPRSPHDEFYAKPEPDPTSSAEDGSPTTLELHSYKGKLGALTSKTATSSSGSPNTPSPKVLSPKPDPHRRREPISILRLSSGRAHDSTVSNTLPLSPKMSYHKMNDVRCTNENDEEETSCISYADSENQPSRSKPPKDFVCPITGQIFSDPVTLETGQTYERKAIHEWIERGNTSCPITRQSLSANSLPKTNYVLKRLITSWKEQHPDLAREFSYSDSPRNSSVPHLTARTPPNNILSLRAEEFVSQRSKQFSQSPTSVISQAAAESIINGLKPFVSCLCTSDKIQECEAAVVSIAQMLKDAKSNPTVCSFLSKPTIVNGLVEILAVSLDRKVLRMSIYILSELISADVSIADTLTSLESDIDCLVELFKNGLIEAVVLIHQLRPSFARLSKNDLIPSLTRLIASTNQEPGDNLKLFLEPKDAAILMLEQILVGGDEHIRYRNARTVISGGAIPSLIQCMDKVETRLSVISILMCCIGSDKGCRVVIAKRIEPCLVLELFHGGDDNVRGICVDFLLEMVYLEKRTICNSILEMVKEEGAFSTMHTFLVYLQMAPMEQQPAIAALLLQLDLLTEPRKMSIYREEAIDALIEALHRKEFPNYQIIALDALLHLTGRFTSSGKLCTEALLLKAAGFNEPYNALMNAENPTEEITEEEEKALISWEKMVASVLCNHEKGSIFKALQECLKNNSIEIAKSCLVVATWLTHMLSVLPDTGARTSAQKYLLDDFRSIVQSSKNMEEKILASLAIKTFITDSAALELLGAYAKCIYKSLKKLKKNSVIVSDILKALMNLTSVNAAELWSYTEVIELDSFANGEVLSLLHLKNQLLSSHSDGTIKMWDTGKKNMRLIQETQEHTKAVTCLCISSSGDQIYSGSLDKTIRVWTVRNEELHCIQVHEVKEPVHELCVNNKVACFVSQGTGVKVYNWSDSPKHANFNKTVKCITMVGDKLYCGCSGYIIQEVDLEKSTWSLFYSGTRKLLGKQTIYALQIHHNNLFAGGSSVDGSAGKVFSLPNKRVIGSFATGFDIQHIAVNSDFIFTATKCGIIEVWLRERVVRVGSIRTSCSGHSKITSLATDIDGGLLFAASSDGKIQVWAIE